MDVQTASDQQCRGLIDDLFIGKVGNFPCIPFMDQLSPEGMHL
jgi:hypothetical protein